MSIVQSRNEKLTAVEGFKGTVQHLAEASFTIRAVVIEVGTAYLITAACCFEGWYRYRYFLPQH